MLAESGVPPAVAERRGYRTVTEQKELEPFGFGRGQRRVPALLVPLWSVDGEVRGCQIRPDEPRTRNGKPVKYDTPIGQPQMLDVPPDALPMLGMPDVPIWITEGAKKADAAVGHGLCCVSLSGVWNWRGKNPYGGATAIADWEAVALKGRKAFIAFDSDCTTKPEVAASLSRLGAFLSRRGASVYYVVIPTADGRKTGLDDYLASGGNPSDLAIEASTSPPVPDAPDVFEWDQTDAETAEQVAETRSAVLRFVPEWGQWIELSEDGVWVASQEGEAPIVRASLDYRRGLCSRLSDAADSTADPQAKAEMRRKARAHESRAAIANTAALAKTHQGLTVFSRTLDADPYLLGVDNGVLDLRTGKLCGDPGSKLVTKRCRAAYREDAECPEFERFIETMLQGDLDLVKALTVLLAYCLDGTSDAQVFAVLYGPRGRNGKSTLAEAMRATFGDYCKSIDKNLMRLGGGESARFSIAQLEGARMAWAQETDERSRLNTEFIKEFTAGDMVFAERKGCQGYQYKPQATLFYGCNHLPTARFDPSLRSRVFPIPFNQSFYAEDDELYQPGDITPDRSLPRKLSEERDGILALLAKVYRLIYLNEGIYKPRAVKEQAAEYERMNDTVILFLTEKCELGAEHRTRTTTLFGAYVEFCKRLSLPAPTRMNEFVLRLRNEPGLGLVRPHNISTVTGIRLVGADVDAQWWNKE